MPDRAPALHPDVLLAQAGWVRAVARALVLDAGRVDDVVQETWLAALERPGAEITSVRAWLAGIVRNVVREERRSASRRAARERGTSGPEPLPPAAELVERADLHRRLVQAVLELDEPYRSTLLWRYFEELSAEEIARRLGDPASTVRSRLQTALETLRARFDRERGGDRRAWSLALIPLMLPRGSAGAALVTTASTGVLAMTVKGLVATSLVVAAGFGLSYAGKLVRSVPPGPAPVVVASPASAHARTAAPAIAPTAQESQRRALQAEPPPSAVQGRVLDPAGAPLAGVRVLVGGQPSPFVPVEDGLRLLLARGDEEGRRGAKGEPGEDYGEHEIEGLAEWAAIDVERLKKHGAVLGKTLLTDAEGRFEAPLDAGTRVYVTVAPQLEFEKSANGAWHVTPCAGLELRARPVPIAELALWVTDLTTGKKIPFAGRLSSGERALADWGAEGEVVHRRVALVAGNTGLLCVEVTAPAWARSTREFHAAPGENALELLVQSGAGLPGEVVDALGQPLEGAVVFWGDVLDLREDSLFRAFRPERVVGGVRTDAAGRFTLPGTAERIAAWHPEHSAVSVAAREATRLVLPARGGIHGLLLDERGLPAVGKEVTLDRARKTLTDAQGAYSFAGVEAGVHGVAYWPERFVGVIVASGETLEIPPAEPFEPRGQLTSGGVPFAEPDADGVFLGLEPVFSVSEWGHEDGRLVVGRVRAGRHLLMSGSGILRVHDFQPGRAEAIELGTARVTLERPDRADPLVYLLPEEASAHPAVRYFARRFFDERADGRLVFAPLPAGRYVIVVEGGDAPLPLDVAEGQELVIPREQWLGRGTSR